MKSSTLRFIYRRVRPWFGDDGDEWQSYTQYIPEGLHVFRWSFEYKGQDPGAGVWLDNIRFYTREGEKLVASPMKDLGYKNKEVVERLLKEQRQAQT